MMSWAIHNVDFLASTTNHFLGSIGHDPIANLLSGDSHTLLANQFNQDILGDLTKSFGKFVKTGQLWAMLIGFVLGFVFKSITSYG